MGGDRRLCGLRGGVFELLSADHSPVGDLVRPGALSWDKADQLELEKIHGSVQVGDRCLLCSDGLNRYADFATLCRMLGEGQIESLPQDQIGHALAGGGADDISVILVDVV